MLQEITKERLERYSLMGSMTVKLTVALGVIALFAYCAFQANFFPTGLSIGDTLLFLFVALGFGIFYLFWLGMGIVACYFTAYPFKKNMYGNDGKARYLNLLLVPIFLILLFIISSVSGDPVSMIAPIFSGAVIVIVTYFRKEPLPESPTNTSVNNSKQVKALFVFIAVFFIPLIGGSAINLFVGSTVRILGLSVNHASLVVNDESLKTLRSVAAEHKIPVMGCQVEGTDLTILHNFKVWWHGMGDRSLVELLKPTTEGLKGIAKVELKKDDINVVSYTAGKNQFFDTCFSFKSDALFDFSSSEPNALGVRRINKLEQNVRNYLDTGFFAIESVEITGHTDNIPVISGDDSNIQLSERRAKAVKELLNPLFNEVAKENIDTYGVGSLSPIKSCSNSLTNKQLKECLAPNRRVEVKFRLIQVQEANKTSKADA
ncbi:hypothetical protein BCU88_09250 [Vibrio splendidus]|uniref:OmpA family protein n=1 Tax=Vibrio splendidus TaxID=29497 RepID=UPI000C83C8A4|nr:OmpA family protein [Vibrio splendidus]PMG61664.1 hypothetical protein BCU88_09250 [Vibrio splendidus]